MTPPHRATSSASNCTNHLSSQCLRSPLALVHLAFLCPNMASISKSAPTWYLEMTFGDRLLLRMHPSLLSTALHDTHQKYLTHTLAYRELCRQVHHMRAIHLESIQGPWAPSTLPEIQKGIAYKIAPHKCLGRSSFDFLSRGTICDEVERCLLQDDVLDRPEPPQAQQVGR